MANNLSIQASISGGIWRPSSVATEPVTSLHSWAIMKVRMKGEPKDTYHLVGHTGYEGRVCSALTAFNPETMTGITSSGRQYILSGSRGKDRDAEYVWGKFKKINEVETEEEVSPEDLAKAELA